MATAAERAAERARNRRSAQAKRAKRGGFKKAGQFLKGGGGG